jgi:hypothetical protein
VSSIHHRADCTTPAHCCERRPSETAARYRQGSAGC